MNIALSIINSPLGKEIIVGSVIAVSKPCESSFTHIHSILTRVQIQRYPSLNFFHLLTVKCIHVVHFFKVIKELIFKFEYSILALFIFLSLVILLILISQIVHFMEFCIHQINELIPAIPLITKDSRGKKTWNCGYSTDGFHNILIIHNLAKSIIHFCKCLLAIVIFCQLLFVRNVFSIYTIKGPVIRIKFIKLLYLLMEILEHFHIILMIHQNLCSIVFPELSKPEIISFVNIPYGLPYSLSVKRFISHVGLGHIHSRIMWIQIVPHSHGINQTIVWIIFRFLPFFPFHCHFVKRIKGSTKLKNGIVKLIQRVLKPLLALGEIKYFLRKLKSYFLSL